MLRTLPAAATLTMVFMVAGCADPATDAGDQLADRVAEALADEPEAVVDRLGQQGISVDADEVRGSSVNCPDVRDPEVGDLATCTVLLGGRTVAVDVEFAVDDAIQVVAVSVEP